MAVANTTWGAGSGSSNPHQVGIGYTISGTSVTVYYYVRDTYNNTNDDQTLTLTGHRTGTVNFRNTGGETLVTTRTFTGTRGSSYTVGARLSGVYNGGTPSHSRSISVPALRPAAPATPSATSTNNRVSSSWTAPANNGASISRYQVQYARNSGFTSGVQAYYTTSRSHTYTANPNTTYWVRVRAENSVGWSNWSGSRQISTKPNGPIAPSNFTVSRTNDSTIGSSWRNNATTAAPTTRHRLRRRDSVNTGYVDIATPGSSATSHSDRTTVANRRYRYAVRSENSEGNSAWVYSADIDTTPGAPSSCVATKDDSGNIVITWVNNSTYPTAVQVWHAANGVWESSPVATIAAGGQARYVYANANPLVTHTFRVRAVSASPVLYSGYAISNVVQLAAPPNAPTLIAPTGAVDAHESTRVEWRHNPVDSSPQSARQTRVRVQGTTAWNERPAQNTANQYTNFSTGIAGADWGADNGDVIEWSVRTKGQHADWGPWATPATLILASTPTVSVDLPTNWAEPTLLMEWGYFQAEGRPQASAMVELINPATGGVVETRTVNGTATQLRLTTVLADGSNWRVRVRVRSNSGQYSEWASQDFRVGYPKPLPAIPSVEYDPERGAAVISIDNPEGPTDTHEQYNYVKNPSFEHGTTGWSLPSSSRNLTRTAAYTGQMWAEAYEGGGGETGRQGRYIAQWEATGTRAETYLVSSGTLGDYIPVEPGEFVAARAQIASDANELAGIETALVIQFRGANNTPISEVDSGYRPALFYKGQIATVSGEVPDEAIAARIVLWAKTSDRETLIPEGKRVWVDAIHLAKDSTEAGALEQVERYFDGDSPTWTTEDGYSVIHSWEGTPGDSPSVASYVPAPQTISNDVYRRINGGEWELIATGVVNNGSYIDPIPPLQGLTEYQVVSWTELPSAAESEPVELEVEDPGWLYVNWGPNFGNFARMYGNLNLSGTTGRAKALHHFAGREYPVLFLGEQLNETYTVDGRITPDASPLEDFKTIATQAGVVMVRDTRGGRLFGSIGEISWTHERPIGLVGLSFGVDRIDYSEEPHDAAD